MDGLARISTKQQPSVVLCHQGQDCDLKGPNPNPKQVSIDQLIKMDDQATHRFSRTIWPKNAMVGKMRAAQPKLFWLNHAAVSEIQHVQIRATGGVDRNFHAALGHPKHPQLTCWMSELSSYPPCAFENS